MFTNWLYRSGKPPNSYQSGYGAETIARLFLILKGYRILAHRYRSPFGEVDLIVKKGSYIIAVEVKYRKTLTIAAEAIGTYQKRRIRKGLLFFLAQNPDLLWKNLRFDAILISFRGLPRHLKNAWFEEERT